MERLRDRVNNYENVNFESQMVCVYVNRKSFLSMLLSKQKLYLSGTSLHLAAESGKERVVEILLRNGANIHEKEVEITEMKSGGDGKPERQSEQL